MIVCLEMGFSHEFLRVSRLMFLLFEAEIFKDDFCYKNWFPLKTNGFSIAAPMSCKLLENMT